MYKFLTLALFTLIFLAIAGCQSTAPPNLTHPGSAQVQQNRAVRFDPYPENQPSQAMAEVRPRDYQNPIPETARARWQLGNVSP